MKVLFSLKYSVILGLKLDVGVEVNESRTFRRTSEHKSTECNIYEENMEIVNIEKERSVNELSINKAVNQKTIIPLGSSEFTMNFELKKAPQFSNNQVYSDKAVSSSESSSDMVVTVNSMETLSDSTVKMNGHAINTDGTIKKSEVVPGDFEITEDAESVRKSSKSQYSIPRFEVTIGRAQLADPAKAVVLKKVKRRRVSPNDAAERGITDKKPPTL
ncbi:dystonin [Caerostris extrusa]|uniref:Dystonin n=1 Tax=Caerostris extrusa TaxID=172846 RepID=A0AAV4XW55_CAEEX|nr:dystonin [Caerostris extrusa]